MAILLSPEATFDVVALAASAGGLKAISEVLHPLPADFPAAVLIVQHLAPQGPNLLVEILRSRTKLLVKQAMEGDKLQMSTVYVAASNWHLLVTDNGTIALNQKDRVNFTRPAADCLFESLAQNFKTRAIAVVLTGKGRDGAKGIQAIQRFGGTTIAQDEASAEYFGMPGAAIATHAVNLVLPLHQIAPTLVRMVRRRKD